MDKMKLLSKMIFLFALFHFLSSSLISPAAAAGGTWQLLQQNIGITAMHMQLLHNDRVVIFDRTDFGRSNLSLPDGKCRNNPNDKALTLDCTAHSAEYDVANNTLRPLMVQTDVWCSSGSVNPDGNLVQTGGYNDGERHVRVFEPCTAGCDWKEYENGLAAPRWYSSNHILPDGRQIIIGGIGQPNYEFYPKNNPSSNNVYYLPFLSETNDERIGNNLYPFVFLNTDGNLFIFANNRAILFDYVKNTIVKTYPTIPGGDPRSYPSTGSAVLLPLKNLDAQVVDAEVLVCGGAPKGSYGQANSGTFVEALKTCGRIKITDLNPQWVVETMPEARTMGDMILLPDGTVLIVNGGSVGVAGWELGRNPVFNPIIYRPDNAFGSRFERQNPTTIPRMYHSNAVLLRDGRVLVGGSNPHERYEFGSNVLLPTELRLEAFNPDYLDAKYANLRPRIHRPKLQSTIKYGQKLGIWFSVRGRLARNSTSVTMVAPSFTTHSFAMNQRMLVLAVENVTNVANLTYRVTVTIPGSGNLAPSGFYLLYVVHQQIPSEGTWVQIV